jgi:hypothetical protein
VLDDNAVEADPTGTIGLGGVEVLVESEPDEGVTGGGFWPLGITISVDGAPRRPLPPMLSRQSRDVGCQLSVLPDPDDEPGRGEQPARNKVLGGA